MKLKQHILLTIVACFLALWSSPFGMRILCVVILLVGSIGCSNSQQALPSNANSAWQLFSPEDKAFQASLPGVPTLYPSSFTSAKYGKIEVQHVAVESNGYQWEIIYNDYPRALTDSEVQIELKNTNTIPVILEISKVEVSNVPAIEVLAKKWPIYTVSRYFISDKQRMYSLHVGGTRDPRKDQTLMDRFFDSFQIARSAVD